MATRKNSSKTAKLGQSPWKSINPMSPVTKKNTTPQQNKDAYTPSGKGYPKKQKTGGGTPSRGR